MGSLDKDYYKGDHLNTPHLKKFMNDARNLFAGPPDIPVWELNKNYTID
jgi:quinol monooxygenase YgiN